MDYKEFSGKLMRYLMPQSYPLGVKIIRGDDTMPDDAATPAKFGITIALCQWTTLARRWGWIAGAAKSDISCTPCLVGFGMKQLRERDDLTQFIMEMGYSASREIAQALAEKLEPVEPGTVKGVLSFPLHKAPADPDLILIYGNPAQMARLATGYMYHHGRPISSETYFGLSCLAAVMPFWRDEPIFVHPGRGERILAGTYDDEMLFTMPAKYAESLLDGLEKTHQQGSRYPSQSYLLYQPPLIPPMKNLDEKLVDE